MSFPGRLCETLRSAPTGPTWLYSTIQIFPPFYTFRLGFALLFKYSRHFTHSAWIWLYYSNIPAILRLQVGFGYSIQIFPPFYTFRLGLALLFKYSCHFTPLGWVWLLYSNISAILHLQVGFGSSIQIFPPFYTFRLGLAL